MDDAIQQLGIFLHLAQANKRRMRPLVRDRMLVLAGALAAEMDLSSIAGYCRSEILRNNPKHIVRRWPTITVALDDNDFLFFLKQVRRRFPLEKAERELSVHGLEMAQERATYYSDIEYAAAILGKSPDELNLYGESHR